MGMCTESIEHVNFSQDGKFLLSTATDHVCIVWDMDTKEKLKVIKLNVREYARFPAAMSADHQQITVGLGSKLVVYNATTGAVIRQLSDHEDHMSRVCFTKDGKQIVTSGWDNTVKIWDATSKQIKATNKMHTASVNQCQYSPHDDGLIATASNDKTVKIIWPAFQLDQSTFTMKNKAQTISWTDKGKNLLVTMYDQPATLIDASTGAVVAEYVGQKDPTAEDDQVTWASMSPDGKLIASVGWDKILRFFDRETTKELAMIKGKHKGEISCCEFSPDGKKLVTGGWDHLTILWDVATREPIFFFKEHTEFVLAAYFSPDGQLVASNSDDNTIMFWDVTSGKLVHTLTGGHKDNVLHFNFVTNTRILSVSYDCICLWDLSRDPMLRVRFLHPLPTEFTSAAMRGNEIVAFDNKGGIYHLQVDNIDG